MKWASKNKLDRKAEENPRCYERRRELSSGNTTDTHTPAQEPHWR